MILTIQHTRVASSPHFGIRKTHAPYGHGKPEKTINRAFYSDANFFKIVPTFIDMHIASKYSYNMGLPCKLNA